MAYIVRKPLNIFNKAKHGAITMKTSWLIASSILIILLSGTSTSWAETRYISDLVVVSLREQPQNNAPPITYLRSDTAIEVIEEAGEYLKARTKEGEVGYILQKYVTTATPKPVIINKLQKERDRLAGKIEEIRQQADSATSESSKSQQELALQLIDLREKNTALQDKWIQSQAELKQVRQDYQALQNDAREVIAITTERDQLRKINQDLSAKNAALDQEVGSLVRTGVIKWFLAGAGVLFFGWILGKASRSRRRSSF
jgi:SH3 domain protein